MCDAPKSKANKTRTPAVPMLYDVNVLLALGTDRHVAHAAAVRWLDGVPAGEATICRMAQTGLLRLLNNPTVMREEVLDTSGCWALWHSLLEDERVCFTPAEPHGLDAAFERYTSGRAFTPRLWTDAYLAAYAQASGLTLVTFDQGFRQFDPLTCHVIESG
jgi:toxin-antitoxin system PIN domain toxin